MSKSYPKSHSKARKRSLSKGKHGGIAAKASMEERKLAAKTANERKPLSHFVWDFFLSLWELGRKLFSSGPTEMKKESSLSLERSDAASSSSVLAAPSGASVAAKRASEEQTKGPAVEELIFGTINDKDPCQAPNWTGNSNEASALDREGVEAVFSSNGVKVGEFSCPDQVGFRKLKNEEAKIQLLERLPVIEDDEIKYERPGSDSEDWKKRCCDERKKRIIEYLTVKLRQVLSNLNEKERKAMNDGLKKEVLKLPAAKIEHIDMILGKTSYTKILRTMFFQSANMTLKSRFSSSDWRKKNRFPRFKKEDPEYQWWEQNFDPDILQKRLEIFREASKNRKPKPDMFKVIELICDLNKRLHPPEVEPHGEDEDELCRILTMICSLLSGGDSKS